MIRPNFVIAGAPKAGTTALTEYLRQHPNVFISKPKETHYFAEDLTRYRFVKTEKEYLGLFEDAGENRSAVGEGSVFYLYSESAFPLLSEFDPAMKFIVMFRNPLELVHSLHSQLVYSRDEDVEEFEQAWKLCSERKAGKQIPKDCRESKILYYDELGKMGEQYEKLLKYFPKQQVLQIFFEDFSKDTKKEYDRVLDFLDLPMAYPEDFKVINKRKAHKYKWLAILTQRPPAPLRKTVGFFNQKIKSLFGIERFGVINKLRDFNRQSVKKQQLSRELQESIIENYRDDIDKLSSLTGRDLSGWKVVKE
jgi:hypothetical protein